MSRQATLHVLPALFEEGGLKGFLDSGQTISFASSSRSNALAIYATRQKEQANVVSSSIREEDLYIVGWDNPPTGERRVFITDTSVIFAACRKLCDHAQKDNPKSMRSIENLSAFRKLTSDYILHLQDCWIYATQLASTSDSPPQFSGEHYRSLYISMSLFQTLYLPEDGVEDVPVGDELLEWLNTHFIEPSTEEGEQLSTLEEPWEDEIFWPYLIRATLRGLLKSSIFFLKCLERHPSENMQRIAERLVGLLEKHPRQRQFTTEKEFLAVSRRWRDRAKALRIELDRVPENDRNDGFENWWDNVSNLLGVLEGREDVLRRVCVELGGGWKEIVCTYGIWIDVSLRRAELPDIVARTLLSAPPDPTDKEDALHVEMAQGRLYRALAVANEIDVWLSAHLVDIMQSLGLLETDVDEEVGLSIRDQYVIAYADYLHSDPGLWRLNVDYLCTCGDIGKEMADEVLVRVPLNLSQLPKGKGRENMQDLSITDMDVDVQSEGGDLSGVVKELNATCFEYQREYARRQICKTAAQNLVNLKKYGLAVSFCRSAEDWTGLGHIVDSVMEEYIVNGSKQFVKYVSEIAPLAQEFRAAPGPQGIFVQRLTFAVRYADFHRRNMQGDTENAALDLISIFEEDLAPRAWWGALLYDLIPFFQYEHSLYFPVVMVPHILQRLEEVTLRTNQGCGGDYLTIMNRILKLGGSKDALKRLDILRLALARYLARCMLTGLSETSGVTTNGH